MKNLKAATAWLIYWEVMGDHYSVKDGDVVTILSSRLGGDKVYEYLELIYKTFTLTLGEKLKYRQLAAGPYKVVNPVSAHGIPFSGLQYSIGTNPLLTAKKVHKLSLKDGQLTWQEYSLVHPDWFCKDTKNPDCEFRGKPAKVTNCTYEFEESN